MAVDLEPAGRLRAGKQPLRRLHQHRGHRSPSRTCPSARRRYGMPGVRVDGFDVLAVYEAATEAVARARRGEGPTLLVTECYRHRRPLRRRAGGLPHPRRGRGVAQEGPDPALPQRTWWTTACATAGRAGRHRRRGEAGDGRSGAVRQGQPGARSGDGDGLHLRLSRGDNPMATARTRRHIAGGGQAHPLARPDRPGAGGRAGQGSDPTRRPSARRCAKRCCATRASS